MAPEHHAVSADPRLHREFADADGFPAAKATQESLVRVHHTTILRGIDYWERALEQLLAAMSSQ
jgi:hypothetical protein